MSHLKGIRITTEGPVKRTVFAILVLLSVSTTPALGKLSVWVNVVSLKR
jgi:hypothetical protein